MCQLRNSFESARVERLTGERKPIAYNSGALANRLASNRTAFPPRTTKTRAPRWRVHAALSDGLPVRCKQRTGFR